MVIKDIVEDIMNRLGFKSDFLFVSMTPYDIAKFIEENTLRTWNNYRGWYHDTTITLSEADIVRTSTGNLLVAGQVTYRLPIEMLDLIANGHEIFSITNMELFLGNYSSQTFFGDANTDYIPMSMYHSNMAEMAYNLSSLNTAIPRVRAKFEAPNKIVVTSAQTLPKNTKYQMKLRLKHTQNLKTITDGDYEAFRQLAMLEVMCYVYHNELKYLDGINTGNTTVELKLDMFEDCDSKLEEFKEKLYNTMSIDATTNFNTLL